MGLGYWREGGNEIELLGSDHKRSCKITKEPVVLNN